MIKRKGTWENWLDLSVIYLCVCWLGEGEAGGFVLHQMSWSGERLDEGRKCHSGAENAGKAHLNILNPWTNERCPYICVCYLWQASEDGGAAGGAAADWGKGVAEHHATLRQRAQVGGVDHRVVIHLCLKTCIISWSRKE